MRDMIGIFGLWHVLGKEDYEVIEELVKKPTDVWKVLKKLREMDAEDAKTTKAATKVSSAPSTPTQIADSSPRSATGEQNPT